MVIFLVLLAAVVVIGVFIWNYRRQAAAREAASAERMKAFLEQARADAAAHQPAAPSTAAAAPAAAQAVRAAPPQAPPLTGFGLRAPLLNTEQQALYQLLKSGLPEHEVFACVSLAAFIQPAGDVTGFAREAQERRLADAVADFVVCDKSMTPLAAVQCGARSGKAAQSAGFAAACVVSIEMRWVEIAPQALPRRDEVRQHVLGA